MPPLLESSDEESAGEAIPFHSKADIESESNANEEEEEEEEEGDAQEGVYVVERIEGHIFNTKGRPLYQVKWKGYDKPSDMTDEPEENLIDGAQEALDEYFNRIGGRPEKPTKKRKSLGGKAASTPDKPLAKKGKMSKSVDRETSVEDENSADWMPTTKNWDGEVECVSTITRDTDSDGLVAYLEWKNGKKSRVSVQRCYERCPQKMLQFYEQHLVFKEAP
ncbi:hypothetical protein FQN49_007185 [Arthroderma sp. PD_2]|nr:hypothetical protein FQN49_007185 [Arthroderma sp. PD_2]